MALVRGTCLHHDQNETKRDIEMKKYTHNKKEIDFGTEFQSLLLDNGKPVSDEMVRVTRADWRRGDEYLLKHYGVTVKEVQIEQPELTKEQLITQLFEMSVATIQAVASTEVQLFLANQVFSGTATPEQKQRHGILTALSSACANYYDVTKAEILAGTRTDLLDIQFPTVEGVLAQLSAQQT